MKWPCLNHVRKHGLLENDVTPGLSGETMNELLGRSGLVAIHLGDMSDESPHDQALNCDCPFQMTWYEYGVKGTSWAMMVTDLSDFDERRYDIIIVPFVGHKKKVRQLPIFAANRGDNRMHFFPTSDVAWGASTKERRKAIKDIVSSMFNDLCFIFDLVNCRNVEIVNDSWKLSKKRRRQLGNPMRVQFKTLKIRDTVVKRKSDNTGGESLDSMPWHIRRGHFRDYTQGPGLFGKYKCKVWVPSMTVGSEKNGKVIKSYEVER